jgi:hypothetical protein
MPGTEYDEPEMSFRRGYQQGAIELFYASSGFLILLRGRLCEPGLRRTFTYGG